MLMSASKLARFFGNERKALVAFSGGVDSSVLAKAAFDALGKGALAVTFDTPTLPRSELDAARKTAKRIGIRHVVVKYSELSDLEFSRNSHDRCFFCKRKMAEKLKEVAKNHTISLIVEGTNAEDLCGHRPGYRALKEAGISSPLAVLGYSKKAVRRLAKGYGLDHSKPSGACLASRIPTGSDVTLRRLKKIENAEDFLRSLGLTQVRVRLEGADLGVGRIEVENGEFGKVVANSTLIVKSLPFRKVVLDLAGYS
ncbi:MAG: ATP-dependent sacrificial sulfur transferase LarE [Candidatus Altiarchaeota archaeon]